MLLVVMTPISGMSLAMRWMIDGWVVTMPEGTVKGPEIDLPRNVEGASYRLLWAVWQVSRIIVKPYQS